MKLTSRPSSSSFYESFSDLIFGVLAIFVLISMVFLVLVRHGGGAEDSTALRKALEEARDEARRSRAQASTLMSASFEQKKQLESEQAANRAMADAVKTRGLELVIAVDRTGSMSIGLKDLVETVGVFAAVLPQYSPDFRVMVLAYHEDPSTFVRYPMKAVLPRDKDGRRSLEELEQFLRSITAKGGMAPVLEATAEGLRVFSEPGSFGGAQVFMLLGDTGPFEVNPNNLGLDQLAAQTVASVKQWIGTSEKRKVVSVYAQSSCLTQQIQTQHLPPGQRVSCTYPEESEKFFRDLCVLTNDAKDCESLGSEKMLVYLLRAIRG
jgi:hypothetical protein